MFKIYFSIHLFGAAHSSSTVKAYFFHLPHVVLSVSEANVQPQ